MFLLVGLYLPQQVTHVRQISDAFWELLAPEHNPPLVLQCDDHEADKAEEEKER